MINLLASDLTAKFGRGFSRTNLFQIRSLYLGWQIVQTPSGFFTARVKCSTVSSESDKWQTVSAKSGDQICATLSNKSGSPALSGAEKVQTPSAQLDDPNSPTPSAKFQTVAPEQLPLILTAAEPELFPLPWSHYVRLMSVKDDFARWFYEDEAIVAGWSVRQLDRMISTQHYERTLLSKNKTSMLLKGREAKPEDAVSIEETIRDPYVLDFLNLKDEYSEADLEEAIINHLETFLLEMGRGFTFVARQFHFRIDGESYRMDLVLYHRALRCLVITQMRGL